MGEEGGSGDNLGNRAMCDVKREISAVSLLVEMKKRCSNLKGEREADVENGKMEGNASLRDAITA